jgi:hypothetical protein
MGIYNYLYFDTTTCNFQAVVSLSIPQLSGTIPTLAQTAQDLDYTLVFTRTQPFYLYIFLSPRKRQAVQSHDLSSLANNPGKSLEL